MVEQWSYTKLQTYEECPQAFYRHYVLGEHGQDNAYAQWGILMHNILERNSKGELPLADMISEYDQRFPLEVTEDFLQFRWDVDPREEYYKAGVGFLFNYDGIPQGYTNVECESVIQTTIANKPFIGRLDLLLRNNKTGKLMLLDYKSKKSFRSKAEEARQLRQLYLYSKFVKERYGEAPDKLAFLLIRSNTISEHVYDEAAYKEAVNWAEGVIDKAEHDIFWEFDADRRRDRGLRSLSGRCNITCEFRFDCEAKL